MSDMRFSWCYIFSVESFGTALCRNGQNYRRFEGTCYLLLHCRDPFVISTLRVTSHCKIILKCFLKLAVLMVREHTHTLMLNCLYMAKFEYQFKQSTV